MARIPRLVGFALGIAVALVILFEVTFRLAGIFVAAQPLRADDGSTVVLCIGDSHTRGRADPENYPAQLEQILNERTNRHYRVINLGVPGQNTAQIRSRFQRYLDYYRPAFVLHWAGINNAWNQGETRQWRSSLITRAIEGSRLLRFLRVWVFYRRLSRQALDASSLELLEWKKGEGSHWRLNFAGAEEEMHTDPGTGQKLAGDQLEAKTRDDVTAMMRQAWGGGVPMYLAIYPIRMGEVVPVDQAIVTVSAEFNLPYIDSVAAARALGGHSAKELYDSWGHPTPILYRQIAEEAFKMLVSQGIVSVAHSTT